MWRDKYLVMTSFYDMRNAHSYILLPPRQRTFEHFGNFKKAWERMQAGFPDYYFDREVVRQRKYPFLVERVNIYDIKNLRPLLTKASYNGYELLDMPSGIYVKLETEHLSIASFEKLADIRIPPTDLKGKAGNFWLQATRAELELPEQLILKRRPPITKAPKGIWERLRGRFR